MFIILHERALFLILDGKFGAVDPCNSFWVNYAISDFIDRRMIFIDRNISKTTKNKAGGHFATESSGPTSRNLHRRYPKQKNQP